MIDKLHRNVIDNLLHDVFIIQFTVDLLTELYFMSNINIHRVRFHILQRSVLFVIWYNVQNLNVGSSLTIDDDKVVYFAEYYYCVIILGVK